MVATSSLVVELVVIGVGASAWMALFATAAFGNQWLQSIQPYAAMLAFPALAFIYTLGIVSDRMIDSLFGMIWGGSLRRLHFSDNESYHHARRTVLTRSDRMADLIEYSRSRMRICRGWAFHAVLIAVALGVYCAAQVEDPQLALRMQAVGCTTFCLLGFACWLAWRSLAATQYLKVREQSRFLQAEKETRQSDSSSEGWSKFRQAA